MVMSFFRPGNTTLPFCQFFFFYFFFFFFGPVFLEIPALPVWVWNQYFMGGYGWQGEGMVM
jgi:hypothetical protein